MLSQKQQALPLTGANRDVQISTGISRKTTTWKNQIITWGNFVKRLSQPVVTNETLEEYSKMSKAEKNEVKDVGGFVGGFLKEGRRRNGYLHTRTLLVLDADSPSATFIEDMEMLYDFAWVLYSTHSHTESKPKYRVVIPLSRNIYPDEYEPIIRKVASIVGMNNFDDTTYESERLMYWASCSADAEYVFKVSDAEWLNPDTILNQYENWKDATQWAYSDNQSVKIKRMADKQGNPLEKDGAIGAFCKSYNIHQAIAEFLPTTYTVTSDANRYSYSEGSTAGGLVVYDDVFAYSHHGTDPVSGLTVNAFDLVRLHKFGYLDSSKTQETATTKLPSYKEMMEFAKKLPIVSARLKEDALGADEYAWNDTPINTDINTTSNTTSNTNSNTNDIDALLGLDDDMYAESLPYVINKPEDVKDWIETDGKKTDINAYLLARQVNKEIDMHFDGEEWLRYNPYKGIWVGDVETYLNGYITKTKLKKETSIQRLKETVAASRQLLTTIDNSDSKFRPCDLDKLVLANGVYDVKKGTLEKFDAKYHATIAHPVKFDANATCPTFKAWIEHALGADVLPFIFEWFGYAFHRKYTIQKMLFILGRGGTGKSTLLSILQALVGDENYSSVSLHALMNERFAKVSLRNKVINFDADTKNKYLADADALKLLTGGDVIHADRKNREPVQFVNYAKQMFAMNELPTMTDNGGALKRRTIVVRMDKPITKETKEKYPIAKIMDELPGIFNESMSALRRLLENGQFTETEAMQEELDTWTKSNDPVQMFAEEMFTMSNGNSETVADVYEEYKRYCEKYGYKYTSIKKLNKQLADLGFVKNREFKDNKTHLVWQNIELN